MIPSYGGHYFDAQGNVHAFVTNLTDTLQAKRIFTQMVEERPRGYSSPGEPAVIIHHGAYTYPQLTSWREVAVHHVWGIDGVLGMGVDVRNNAVRVDVAHERARSKVVDSLATLGVPRAAVRVRVVPGRR